MSLINSKRRNQENAAGNVAMNDTPPRVPHVQANPRAHATQRPSHSPDASSNASFYSAYSSAQETHSYTYCSYSYEAADDACDEAVTVNEVVGGGVFASNAEEIRAGGHQDTHGNSLESTSHHKKAEESAANTRSDDVQEVVERSISKRLRERRCGRLCTPVWFLVVISAAVVIQSCITTGLLSANIATIERTFAISLCLLFFSLVCLLSLFLGLFFSFSLSLCGNRSCAFSRSFFLSLSRMPLSSTFAQISDLSQISLRPHRTHTLVGRYNFSSTQSGIIAGSVNTRTHTHTHARAYTHTHTRAHARTHSMT